MSFAADWAQIEYHYLIQFNSILFVHKVILIVNIMNFPQMVISLLFWWNIDANLNFEIKVFIFLFLYF